MPRPSRRRLLRSAASFLLLVAGTVAMAQLAGVGGGTRHAPTTLVFDGSHDRWLVQVPARSSSLDRATARLGGGKAGRSLAGGWREVALSEEVAAADAQAAFAEAGATQIEPVVPRSIYEEPAPDAVTDAAGAQAAAGGEELRSGPTRASRLAEQWALQQTSDQDIDGVEAWNAGTGAGSIVAVIDTGVDASHPDLAGRVLEGRDFSGVGTSATTDAVGHGTAVASVIAARGVGIAGVAPDARILPLKVFRDSPTSFSMSGYLEAIRYAVDADADVINISLGCGGTTSCFSQAELDALAYANDHGVVVVTAAGNGDPRTGSGMDNDNPETPDFPSGYELPNIISVTSSTRMGNWSTWSNYGSQTVDLAAPGEGILVASPGGAYRTLTGTSFSAPHVSGAAAVLASAMPGTSAPDVRARIMSSTSTASTLAGRAASGILNVQSATQSHVVGGGGASVDLLGPATGVTLAGPPVLTWRLAPGWRTVRVQLRSAAGRFDAAVQPTRRAFAHPSVAWRAGTYTWQVVARSPGGVLATTRSRTYRIAPRVDAWVGSGGIRSRGRELRLRIGYAANELRAATQISVLVGRRSVHAGTRSAHTEHLRGVGTPRRGTFDYRARLSTALRVGQRVTVVVRVSAGGATVTRRFTASVA